VGGWGGAWLAAPPAGGAPTRFAPHSHRPPALAPPATVHALRTSPANRCAPDSHLRKPPTGPHAHDVPEESPPIFTPSGHFANGTKEQNSNWSPLREKDV